MSLLTINPGELRTQITLQSPSINKDSGGAQKAGYSNAGTNPTVLARWINSHGEENAASAVKSVQRATVIIRARTDVDATWQVLKDNEPWHVISVDHIRGENRWTELVVERVKGSV
jgi:head-tail adaptor